MTDRRLDPQALALDPTLAGQALPSPRRRMAAFAIDYALLLLPTLATALLCAGLALRWSDRAGYTAVRAAVFGMPQEPAAQHAVLRDLARVLAHIDAEGLSAAVKADVEAGDLDRAADRLADVELLIALDLGGGEPVHLAPNTVRLGVERLIPDGVRNLALFLVPAIYFAVATSFWGTTVGKRLLGLRVVRLDGRPLSLFEGIERFGAYFGILGTLGLGLFDLWRDPNRRLGHDRAADTVVLRAVRPTRIESPAEAP